MPTVSGIVVATSSEASGRRTLLDVVDELARPVDPDDSTVRALAGDAFRAAVRTMNRKGCWPWEVQDEEITLTANSAFSTATGAVKKPLSMHYLTASGGNPYRKIGYQTYDRFVENWSFDVSGQPTMYSIPNMFETGQIRWFPTPSSAYFAKFTYYRITPAPRTEQEAVEIPDYALDVYQAFAWYEFLKRLPSQQQPVPIQIAMADARLAFRELCAHVNSPGDRSRMENTYFG